MPAKKREKTEFVSPVLSAVLLKTRPTINRITAALVLSACVVAAAAQSDSPAFAKFKREMMPKVGQKIMVVGTWSDQTKQCCWLAFNKWGAFVYGASSAREKYFLAHFRNGETVKLTGTLRYFPKPAATRNDEQSPEEHFFFDAAEVKMSRWPPPQNPKK